MYVGCAQKVIVAPTVILNSARGQKQFLTSSLKTPVGGASYFAIIFLIDFLFKSA